MKNRIIVALDNLLPLKEMLSFAENLIPYVGGYKISAYIDRYGVSIIPALKKLGGIVMTDLKICDIPSQAARRVGVHIDAGADFVTVHASGGENMLKSCVVVAPTQVIAVTILSSLHDSDSRKLFGVPVREKVQYMVESAYRNNVAGIVCAPQDLQYLNTDTAAKKLLKFTPNVLPAWASVQSDQSIGRSMTPQDALKAGAHYVVIGRPIIAVKDPLDAARRILHDIEEAFSKKP